MKNEKAITLIALVITIIILLILAGITISQLAENGLFNKAEQAQEKNEIAEIYERLQNIVYEIQIEKEGEATLEDIVDKLEEDAEYEYTISLTKVATISGEVDITGASEIYVICKGHQFKICADTLKIEHVSSINEDEETSKTGILSEIITAKDYGKKINYSIDLDGNETTNDWKIFYNNGTNVFIIASDYLDNSFVDEEKTGMTKSGNKCVRWTSVPDYQNIDLTVKSIFQMNTWLINSKDCIKCISTLVNQNNWTNLKVDNVADYVIGSPTLGMWINSWNQKYPDSNLSYDADGQHNCKVKDGENNLLYYNLSEKEGSKDELYFLNYDSTNNVQAYFICTLGSMNSTTKTQYMYSADSDRRLHGGRAYLAFYTSLRPVVCLNSLIEGTIQDDVTINDGIN